MNSVENPKKINVDQDQETDNLCQETKIKPKKKENKYVLGIDIGTTSVKITVVEKQSQKIVLEYGKPAESYINQNDNKSEQDPVKIVETLDCCMQKISKKILKQVIGIGICGQMHGLICWSSTEKPWTPKKNILKINRQKTSPHYTWQDGRCTPTFLQSLPKQDSHLTIHTGFGCSTLFWVTKNSPELIENYNCAGTIADFIVAMLCDLDKPIMTPQNAASWGYYNTESDEWNIKILENADFPVHLLPTIMQPKTIAGNLKMCWHQIPAGVPVGVALGDLQSSVYALLNDENNAMVNISTSAQLVFVERNFNLIDAATDDKSAVKIVPYFEGKYLYEVALLNGGNALSLFVSSIYQFLKKFGSSIKKDALWTRLINYGIENDSDSDLSLIPAFIGERFDPELRGSINNIHPDNFQVVKIFRALCKSIISSFHNILSTEDLKTHGIIKIIGTGSALLKNKVLQMELEKQYNLPIEFKISGDAPFGAALSILDSLTDIE